MNGMKYRCTVTCDDTQSTYCLFQSADNRMNGIFQKLKGADCYIPEN